MPRSGSSTFTVRRAHAPETLAAWTAVCGLSGVTHSTHEKTKLKVVSGRPTVTDRVAALTRDAGAAEGRLSRHTRSFFQGNRFVLPALVTAVCRRVTVGPVMDLYAGVGLFAVALASLGLDEITAVERDPSAAADLEATPHSCDSRSTWSRHRLRSF